MNTPKLTTKRLRLAPFYSSMATDRYVSWLNDPEVVRYSENRHRSWTLADCADYVNRIDHINSHIWAIELDSLGHIGNISARRDVPNNTADIAILIGERASQGQGYGTEAWIAICDWLLAGGVRKVTAGTMAENVGMLSVFNKAGMSIEGRRKDQFLLDGRPVDLILAARFNSELAVQR